MILKLQCVSKLPWVLVKSQIPGSHPNISLSRSGVELNSAGLINSQLMLMLLTRRTTELRLTARQELPTRENDFHQQLPKCAL